MSRSTMYCVREDGFCQPHLNLQNSHGTGPVIWTTLVERYGLRPLPGEWDAWGALFKQVEDGSLKLEWWEHNALWWTYDNAMLRLKDFQLMAQSLRLFAEKQRQDRISHGVKMAEALEGLAAEPVPPLAACMWVTDLSDNPWATYSEDEDQYLFYNLLTGNSHQFIELLTQDKHPLRGSSTETSR